jgi:site-specific recombinase XerC
MANPAAGNRHIVRAQPRGDTSTRSRAAAAAGAKPTDRNAATRVRIADLTPPQVTKALSALQRSGAADKSRARLHGTLSGLFAYLVQQGHLEVDPLVVAGLERPKVAARLPRPPSD